MVNLSHMVALFNTGEMLVAKFLCVVHGCTVSTRISKLQMGLVLLATYAKPCYLVG